MNPGEQDRNPFRQPSPSAGFAPNTNAQPNNTINTSRYFGNAPRRTVSGRIYGVGANTPEFFQQAMAQQTAPQTYEMPKAPRNRKPLFIGLGVVAGIIILILLVTLLPKKIGEITNKSTLSDLKNTLSEYKEGLFTLDDGIRGSYDFYFSSGLENDKEYREELIDGLEKTKKLRKKLDEYKYFDIKTQLNEVISVSKYTDELASLIDERMPAYTAYEKLTVALLDIYISDGDESKIDAFGDTLTNPNKDETVNNIKKFYRIYKKIEAKNTDLDTKALTEYEYAYNALNNDKSIELTMYKALDGKEPDMRVRELVSELNNSVEVVKEDYE